jgi:hypothetical protein
VKNDSKKPIVVGGRSYASVGDMPPEVRRVYELALSAKQTRGEDADANIKVYFNGQEYENIDSMPADTRRLYENMMAALETSRDFRDRDATSPRAKKPAATPAPVKPPDAEIPTQAAAHRPLGNLGTKKVRRQKILLISGLVAVVAVLLILLLMKSG